MSIKIIKVNAAAAVQDSGRWGFQSSGVPVSGAMDEVAMYHANTLVGNKASDACLEIGMGSLEIKISGGNLVSFTGEGHHVLINSIEVALNKPVLIQEECSIKLKPKAVGLWSYMAVGGGVSIPIVFSSKSTYLPFGFGGFEGRALMAGDALNACETKSRCTQSLISTLSKADAKFVVPTWSIAVDPYNVRDSVRIMPGPEWSWLSDDQQENICNQSFIVSNDYNRMGYRLEGLPISRNNKTELISSGVTRGTIQLTNEGNLIVLMADSQTVGGYPRVAQVASVDIPKLAQSRPGTTVRFNLISHVEAEQLLLSSMADIKKIGASVRLKSLA